MSTSSFQGELSLSMIAIYSEDQDQRSGFSDIIIDNAPLRLFVHEDRLRSSSDFFRKALNDTN